MDATVVQYTGSTADSMIRLQSNGGNPAPQNVQLSGFTLDGLSGTTANQGIEASSSGGHHIHQIRVRNLGNAGAFGPHGIYFSAAVSDSVISDSEFINIGVGKSFGGGIRMEWGSNRNQVLRNTVRDTGRGGIFTKESTDIVIQDNTVSGSGAAFPGLLGLGIEVWGNSHRTVVEDNVIDHWLSVDKSDYVAVRRNTVKDTSGTLKFLGLELGGGSDVIFTDNEIGQGNHIGLSLSNNTPKQRVLIAYNSFSRSETWGSQLQDDEGEIRQVYLLDNTFELAEADPPDAYPNAGRGFRFNAVGEGAGIYQLVFDGNRFIDNDRSGIQFAGSAIDQLSFVNNTITGNGQAIEGSFPGSDIEWVNNTVAGNGNNDHPVSMGFANGKPSVAIQASSTVSVGVPVSFRFTYQDDSSTVPSEVLWDFDEDIPDTSSAPTHSFSSVGDFRISLVAWDPQGRAALDQVTITVVPEPSSFLLVTIPLLGLLGCGRRRRR